MRIFEPEDGWSRMNLLQDAGPDAIDDFYRRHSRICRARHILSNICDFQKWLDGVELALVHEWNNPQLDLCGW